MSKKMFIPPYLASGTGRIDIDPSGGLIAQSIQPDILVVELPDGTEVIANEFGEVLDELETDIAEMAEPVIE